MKDEELDRLFKQKSEQYKPAPSPQAWQQLEKQLQHKRGAKKGWYLGAAAACLLLLAGVWLNMEISNPYLNPTAPTAQQETPGQLAIPQPPLPGTRVKEPDESGHGKNSQANNSTARNGDNAEEKEKPGVGSISIVPIKEDGTSTIALRESLDKAPGKKQIPEKGQLPLVDNKSVRALESIEATPEIKTPIALLPEPTEEIIIRYSMDDVERPAQAGSEPENDLFAAPPEERELSARAVVGFLKKVKENSKGGLADIREAKDELLSLRLNR